MLVCCLFSSGASASACVTCASVARACAAVAGLDCTCSLFYANTVAIATRTLFSLLAARSERYSYNSCEQKC